MQAKVRLLFSILLLCSISAWILRNISTPQSNDVDKVQRSKESSITKPDSLSAFGYLEPAGNIRLLGPPIQIQEGARIKLLNVEEGETVKANQVLAVFDTIDRLIAQQETIEAKISNLSSQVYVLERETKRYELLSSNGAVAIAELESRQLILLKLKSELKITQKELNQNKIEQKYSKLYSPINGKVIQIYSRVGELAGRDGVLKVGNTQSMEAIAQVNEDNIRSVYVGQHVSVKSQNGGFTRHLHGTVLRIAPAVTSMQRLTLDPAMASDNENRAIKVRIRLSSNDSDYVRNLSGMNIVANFAAKP